MAVSYTHLNSTYTATIKNDVLHLHGSLNPDDYVIIGIDSTEQFTNDTLKTNPNTEKYCVKSKINQAAGYSDRERNFVSLINAVSYTHLAILGLSAPPFLD